MVYMKTTERTLQSLKTGQRERITSNILLLQLWKKQTKCQNERSSSSSSFLGERDSDICQIKVLFWTNNTKTSQEGCLWYIAQGNKSACSSFLNGLTSIFGPLLETAVPWLAPLARRLAGRSKLAVPRAFAALAFAISSSSIRSFSLRRKGVLLLLRDLVLDLSLHLGRSSGYTVRPKP